ncbi:MAG: hypothetical protein ACOC9B_05735 [Chloroflexota bacterium]
MFEISDRWKKAYPNAMVGILMVSWAQNVGEHPGLESRKRVIEEELRSRFSNPGEIKVDEAIQAYAAYYKRFEKTYHVAGQLKSLVAQQKPLPTVSGLVDVMFMAEMKNLLLTAGHDLATVVAPVVLDAASGVENYKKLNQEKQVAKAGDMMTLDRVGVLSTVIHGPDFRSRIAALTRDAMYVTYAPDGITRGQVLAHIRDIKENILLFAPSATVERVSILSARGIRDLVE